MRFSFKNWREQQKTDEAAALQASEIAWLKGFVDDEYLRFSVGDEAPRQFLSPEEEAIETALFKKILKEME